jgi:hypothetical protein
MKVFARTVIVAALFTAILVPAGQARTGSSGALDPWTQHLLARQTYSGAYGPLDPWTRHLFAREARPSTPAKVAVSRPVSTPAVTADEFEWGTFGIGAASMLGAVLLGGGAVVGLRRRGIAHA